jgi:hypothetical protein
MFEERKKNTKKTGNTCDAKNFDRSNVNGENRVKESQIRKHRSESSPW